MRKWLETVFQSKRSPGAVQVAVQARSFIHAGSPSSPGETQQQYTCVRAHIRTRL